jgi:WD40 repeat protein
MIGAPVLNPFPGLRPFEATDAALFFGRDEQIGEALDRLLQRRLLAVVGVSGCGKSSLVSAGMVPALQMGLAGDPGQRWRVVTMRPGDGPLCELERGLGFGVLPERTYGLLETVERHLPAGENLLLVVDQFEEVFPFRERMVPGGAGSEVDLFVSYLLRAAQDPAGRVFVLLTMRSDYLGECAKFHGLPEALNDGQYLVPRMTRAQLQEAIEGPLAAAGAGIHPTLLQDLLNQCDEEPDNLPLLQHLLRRMFEEWEKSGGTGAISGPAAANVGGLLDALNRDAEAVFEGLPEEWKKPAARLFQRITESSRADRGVGDDRPVRRPQTVEVLAKAAKSPEETVRGVVERFKARSLLVVRRTDEGDKVDLPHECLCLRWARLKELVRSEAENAKKLRFLVDSVGRNHLTGLALGEALVWLHRERLESAWPLRYVDEATRDQVVAWVRESQQIVDEASEKERRREREEYRLLRVMVAVLAPAFLLAALFGAYAASKKREADAQRAFAVRQKVDADQQRAKSEASARGEQEQRVRAEEQTRIAQLAHKEVEKQGEISNSRGVAVEATRVKDTELAALLSVQAMRMADTFEARNSLLSTLQAHPRLIAFLDDGVGALHTLAFSPDGKLLAVAGENWKILIWDVARRKMVGRPLAGHAEGISSLAFSPDGKILVSASFDETIRLWDVRTQRQVGGALRGNSGGVNSVAFSPDGTLLASGSDDATIRLWDLTAHRPVGDPLMGHSGEVLSVAFSPDGKLLASASSDTTVRLWDVAGHRSDGNPLSGHKGVVSSVRFSPTGKLLASASWDATVRLWDVTSRRPLGAPLEGHKRQVSSVAFSPDGTKLASAGFDEAVRLWDVARRTAIGEPLEGHDDIVHAVAFSPDGKVLASTSYHNAALWDMTDANSLKGHTEEVTSVAFSHDGTTLASASADRTIRLWDVAGRRPLGEPLRGASARVNCVVFHPRKRLLASGSSDNSVRLWDVDTQKPHGDPLKGHSGAVTSVAFSPDGSILASASTDHTIRLWDVATLRQLGDPLEGHNDVVWSVAFSPDGKTLASGGGDRTHRMWDVATRRQLSDPSEGHDSAVTSVAFSPNGKTLALEFGGNILFSEIAPRDRTSGKFPHRTLPGDFPGGPPEKGTITNIYQVIFSPDGKLVASTGGGYLRLLEVSRFQMFDAGPAGSETIIPVAFSPTGKSIAGGLGSDVRIWDIDPDSWISRLCGMANRNLSLKEWQENVGAKVPYQRTCPNFPAGKGAR